MRHRPVETPASERFVITAANHQGTSHARLLTCIRDAERCIQGLLSLGVPAAQIKVFQVRPLALAPVAATANRA